MHTNYTPNRYKASLLKLLILLFLVLSLTLELSAQTVNTTIQCNNIPQNQPTSIISSVPNTSTFLLNVSHTDENPIEEVTEWEIGYTFPLPSGGGTGQDSDRMILTPNTPIDNMGMVSITRDGGAFNSVLRGLVFRLVLVEDPANGPPDSRMEITLDASEIIFPVGEDAITYNFSLSPQGGCGATSAYEITVRKPLELVLVLDKSGSMNCSADPNCNEFPAATGPSRWQFLQSSVNTFVNKLDDGQILPGDQFGMVVFTSTGIALDLDGDPANGVSGFFEYTGEVGGNVSDLSALLNDPNSVFGSTPINTALTSIASGLQSYFDIYSGGVSSDSRQVIMVFTDGAETTNPEISLACANDPNCEAWKTILPEGVNDNSFTNTNGNFIEVYSIGFGGSLSSGTAEENKLEAISNDNSATRSSSELGDRTGIRDVAFFGTEAISISIDEFYNEIFDSFSPAFIAVDVQELDTKNGLSFTCNPGLSDLIIESHLSLGGTEGKNFRVFKNDIEVTELATLNSIDDITSLIKFNFEEIADSILSSEGDWQILVQTPSVNPGIVQFQDRDNTQNLTGGNPCYITFSITADDSFLDFESGPSQETFHVGGSISPIVSLSYAQTPLTDASVMAIILKPGDDLGDIMARNQLSEETIDSLVPSVITNPFSREFIAYQRADSVNNSQAFSVLQPFNKTQEQILPLTEVRPGVYSSTYSELDVSGVYEILYFVNVVNDSLGTIQRYNKQTVLVNDGILDLTLEPQGLDFISPDTAVIVFKPAFVSNDSVRLVGPGRAYTISLSGEKTEVVSIKDQGDGSYTLIVKTSEPDPNIQVCVLNDCPYSGPLSGIVDPANTFDRDILGRTTVYLEGNAKEVGNQETNLGNLLTDAYLAQAREVEGKVHAALIHSKGIQAPIGERVEISPGVFTTLPPQANLAAGKEEGDISRLDILKSIPFNHGLTIVKLSPIQLKEVLEYGLSEAGNTSGLFPQVSGIRFAFDPSKAVGSRIELIDCVDDQGETTDELFAYGEFLSDEEIFIVTYDFLVEGGQGYPYPFMNLKEVTQLKNELTEAGSSLFSMPGTEQDALAEYLLANFSSTPYDSKETPIAEDQRIINLSVPRFNMNGFALLDANTGIPIPSYDPLQDGALVNIPELPGTDISIEAFTQPEEVGSVHLMIEGPLGSNTPSSFERIENKVPYTLFGNVPGSVTSWKLPEFKEGETYSVTATPFEKSKGKGLQGTSATISFQFVNVPLSDFEVSSFELADAETDQIISTLEEGDTINLAEVPYPTIVGLTSPAEVGSVSFRLSREGEVVYGRTENIIPYALFGDINGDLSASGLTPGSYKLVATPYTEKKGEGEAGLESILNFEVIESTSTLNIFPNPTSESLLVSSISTEGVSKKLVLLQIREISTGRVIHKKWVQQPYEEQVDVSELVPGLYFIQIIDGEGTVTRKFAKQ